MGRCRSVHSCLGVLAEDLGHTVVLDGDACASTPDVDATLPSEAGRGALTLEPGATVGRYVIAHRIGAGGMGVVYAGHDPKLDRRVAIKMLRPRSDEGRSRSSGRARLLREAQAMAKLSHPNVVAIYDVGLHADRVYLAMEYVDGQTITQWLEDAAPGVEEIVDVFVAAGRGLAAAHAAEFVHRDFKPDNVLVDRRGRVLVMDFGLARATGAGRCSTWQTRDPGSIGEPALPDDALSTPLTHDGTVVGTPAYMSPEQHVGRPPDAASDQYAYCVALFEALAGARPFAGKGLRELALAKANRTFAQPDALAALPAVLRPILVRGLEPHARSRYPTMAALLAALQNGMRPRRFPWAAVPIGLAAVTAGGLIVAAAYAPEEVVPCTGGKLARIWDSDRKMQVRAAFEATDAAFATQTWVRVEQRLDDYAAAWEREYTDACGAGDPETIDLRMRCLEQRRGRLRAAVGQLVDADADVVRRAVVQVSGLGAVSRCSDVASLQADVAPPSDPIAAAAVERLREELDEALALERAGRFDDALAAASLSLDRSAAVDYPPVRVEALIRVAAAQGASGDHAGAEATLIQARELATAVGYDELGADAATRLVYEVGVTLSRFDDALEWGRHATAGLERWGDTSDQGALARARLQSNLAMVHGALGRYDDELAAMQEAYGVKRRILGDDHPEVVGAMENIGLALTNRGQIAAGRQQLAEALGRFRELLGDEHPEVALSAANLAQAKTDMGDYAGAEALFEEARGIWVKTQGEHSYEVGRTLDSLGIAAGAQGRYEEALRKHERALAIFETVDAGGTMAAMCNANMGLAYRAMRRHEEARASFAAGAEISRRAYGREHEFTAALLGDQGEAMVELARYDEAKKVLEEALAIRKRVLPAAHPGFGRSYNALGRLYGMQGRWEEARQYHQLAFEATTAAFGPEHPDTASTHLHLGYVALELSRPDEALQHMERVNAILGPLDVEPAFVAEGRFGLAQALVVAGKERERALSLARRALQDFAAGGHYMQADRDRVQAWLDEQARG